MKTRHFIISALCVPAFILPALAQGLYFGVGGGYGFAAAKQSLGNDEAVIFMPPNTTVEYKSRAGSLGKGINAGLYAGYMFNKQLGAEVGLSYLSGSKTVFTREIKNTQSNTNSKETETYKGRMIRIVPALRMTAGENNLKPYMKCGLIIGLASKFNLDYSSESIEGSNTYLFEENWEFTGGLSLGFHGAVGINYIISDQLGIFAEVAGNYQNWAMKKGVMTKKNNNGLDGLASMETYEKEIEFVDEFTIESGTPRDNNAPDKQTKFYMPFSSIGVNIGVHFTLGGTEDK